MKIIVLGGTGHIGRAIAWDLCRQDQVEKVGIASNQREILEQVDGWLDSKKTQLHTLDLDDKESTGKVIREYDVVAIALPGRRLSYEMIELAIDAGIDCVDILEEYHRVPEEEEIEGLVIPGGKTLAEYGEWLHQSAKDKGVLIIDGMGFAPGLSNITLAHGIRQMEKAKKAIARVGGVPDQRSADHHPLKYMITWAFQHVLREYMVNTTILQDGRLTVARALDGYESFDFELSGQKEELECFITPGMPSFVHTHSQLEYFAEKTIRWPGHWQAIQTLRSCGLLSQDPIEIDGQSIVPRAFLSACLEPKLKPRPGDEDVCIMYNTIEGVRDGKNVFVEYSMWEKADPARGLSAMARVTAFTAAICAGMVGKKMFDKKGILSPEEAIDETIYPVFMEELRKRNINISEMVREVEV